MPKVEPVTLSVTQAQQYIGIGKKTFYLVRKDDPTFPPPVRIGTKDLFRRVDVDVWLASKIRASAVPGLAA